MVPKWIVFDMLYFLISLAQQIHVLDEIWPAQCTQERWTRCSERFIKYHAGALSTFPLAKELTHGSSFTCFHVRPNFAVRVVPLLENVIMFRALREKFSEGQAYRVKARRLLKNSWVPLT